MKYSIMRNEASQVTLLLREHLKVASSEESAITLQIQSPESQCLLDHEKTRLADKQKCLNLHF